MRRALALTTLFALTIGAGSLSAQSKNFAGTWTVVADPNAPAPGRGGGGSPMGQGATVTQDAKTLTITRTTQNGEVKSVYNLDGSESKNTAAGRGGATMESTSLTKWDGNKLVITTSTSFNGNPITSTTTMWLDTAGNLIVESQRPGFNGGAATTTTMTYKKS
jgi:hypothetical protein